LKIKIWKKKFTENPLINFKHTKSKGVHIVNTNSSYVFDFIVNQKKSMEFVELKSEIKPTLPLLKKKELDDSVTSGNKLQTNESEKNLQKNY
jgi:hypothetical protein